MKNTLYFGINRAKSNFSIENKNNFVCKLCEFPSQQTIKQNGNSCCKLCFFTMNLDEIPTIDPGKIILLPQISQSELNNLSRAIWHIESLPDEYDEEKSTVSILQSNLEQFSDYAERHFCTGSSEVSLITQVLNGLNDSEYNNRKTGFAGLRWLPPKSLFEKDIPTWNKVFSEKFPLEKWSELILKVMDMQNNKK